MVWAPKAKGLLNMKRMMVCGALLGMVGGGVLAQDWDAGADLRIRQERLDNIPTSSGIGQMDLRDYMRYRTRVWGQVKSEDGSLLLYGRATQEVRSWFKGEPASGSGRWRWPDEVVLDNLYFQNTTLFGEGSRFRIGRQDIRLGSNRLVFDGTPGDGSRTIFFDGVTLSVPMQEKQTLDVFAVYNHSDNKLAAGNVDRRFMTAYTGREKMDDGGVGFYFTDRSEKDFVHEVYAIYKYDGVTRSVADGSRLSNRGDIYTIGLRMLPRFTDALSGELEAAYQQTHKHGRHEAGMVFASMTYAPEMAWKPTFTAATLYESLRWNALWGRWPVWGELPVFSYDLGNWSNLIHPYVEVSVTPVEKNTVLLRTGPMYAETRGPADGSGRCKGWFSQARWDFPIASGLLKSGDGRQDVLKGHITGEMLKPGDYYPFSNTAYFVRWEVSYAF